MKTLAKYQRYHLGLLALAESFHKNKPRMFFVTKRKSQGQVALETFFVFGAMIFLALTMINFGVMMHTKSIATYAAFMAARSYQVYGDKKGAAFFKEGNEAGRLLEGEKTLPIIRTAEDILTCGLPWLSAPRDDLENAQSLDPQKQKEDMYAGCAEGKRQYKETNINKNITIFRFDKSASLQSLRSQGVSLLEAVPNAYHEAEREPLRYSILKLQYKNQLLYNLMSVFDGAATIIEDDKSQTITARDDERAKRWHAVYVPLLLNPGLNSGLQIVDSSSGNDPDVDANAKSKK